VEGATSFIDRYLDPAESLGEVLFGLIMVLTLTLGAAVAAGYERGLILAAVGCNVAWGVIDGVLFALASRFTRRRRRRLVRAVRRAPDEAAALAAIREELEPVLVAVTQPQDRDRLYRSVHQLLVHAEPMPTTVERDDWMAALAVFLLVSSTAVPAALPFLIVHDPQRALRLSNALLIVLLFVAGYRWARHIDMNPWLSGLVLTGLGVLLVAVAILLGG
jgi:VIT1/CCC1 family predicted Fe2+/Mn2+ transporter